ncbi:MAG: hypothetical protein RL199_2171 [Pseudomonadota bacterium]|jgi:tetratricopeptide (TPR) repeat protein
MTVAAPRVHAYATELDDVTVDIHRLRLQRIKRDCEADLASAVDHQLKSVLHVALGLVGLRLGNYEEALSHFRSAATLDRATSMPLINQAVVLSSLGRPAESLVVLDDATRRADGDHFLAWGNRARALAMMGHHAEASKAFETAVRRSDLNSEQQVFRLASQAAFLGDHVQAVEMLARFFSLRTSTAVGAGGALGLLEGVTLGEVRLPEELLRSLAAVDTDPVMKALVSAPPETDDAIAPVASSELVSHDEAMRLLFDAP